MKKQQKLVQNFQYDESKGFTQDGVDVYIATHVVNKELYLLKKVNLRGNSERAKQKNLINQVNNLKLMSDPTIAECHKMLKTTNNIYLVYDYCDGTTLEELISNQVNLSQAKKEAIAKQIIQALKVMANANIVHGNLTPKSIMVTGNNKIKIMNFVYSHNLEANKEIPLKFKPPSSKYSAPEINDGNINKTSDLYSLGIILNQLNLQSSSRSGNKNSNILTRLLFDKPNDRPTLQEISALFPDGHERKKSFDAPKSSKNLMVNANEIKKARSMRNQKQEENLVTSPRMTMDLATQGKNGEKQFTQLVLKRRNFAIFLLELAEVCMTLEDDQSRLGLLLGFILFKKSTQVIVRLLSFLKNQSGYENEIEANFSVSQKKMFQKKPDHIRLISTINKQASSQKRMLEDLQKSIVPQLNPEMQEFTKFNDVDNKNLQKYIASYLKFIISQQNNEISNKIAAKLFMMSEILPYKSFQKMFDQLINEQKINLQQQSMYTHANNQQKKHLLDQIANRLKQF